MIQGGRPFWAAFLFFTLGGCQSKFDLHHRHKIFDDLVKTLHAEVRPVHVSDMSLQTVLLRSEQPSDEAVVYIEGDGLSWITAYEPSRDPTPTYPMALSLMTPQLTDKHQIYIARPCQYLSGSHCQRWLWTGAVYGTVQRDVINEVMKHYKKALNIRRFHVVGYSGGGVMALLLVGLRRDIASVTTVASNLDTESWIAHQGISALPDSLNPRQSITKLCGGQYHFLWGDKDCVVPYASQKFFAEELSRCAVVKVDVVKGFRHDSAWGEVVAAALSESGLMKATLSNPLAKAP